MPEQLGFPGEARNWWDLNPGGLRYYQQAAVDGINAQFSKHRSTLAVMATGLGKTRTASDLVRTWPGPVLWLAHRSELISQAKHDLEEMTGEWVEIEQAQYHSNTARIVVGSLDTVRQKKRLEKLQARGFTLIVYDEAHGSIAKTRQKVLEAFPEAKLLGLTATPDRGDGKAMNRVWESIACTVDIREGIDMGYLVPMRARTVHAETLDLSRVKTVAGDLKKGELDEVMVKCVEEVVQGVRTHEPDRVGIVFMPGVRSADYTTQRFNAVLGGSAQLVTGETDPDERTAIVRGFRKGEFLYLVNCAVATEGFDAPICSMVVHGRPTKSRALYTQMSGRGGRVLPNTVDHLEGPALCEERQAAIAASPKPDCMLLDFVGNSGRHKLVGPADLLGGKEDTDEVKERTKEILDEEPGKDVEEALGDARADIRKMAEAARQARLRVVSRAEEVDPFGTFGIKVEGGWRVKYGEERASPKQKGVLLSAGFELEDVQQMTKVAAQKLVKNIFLRREKGLCTFRQLRQLKRFGVTTPNVGFKRAHEALDYIFGQKRENQPVNGEVLDGIIARKREPGEEE